MILAGIYIHIPFCRSRCSYCDFATGMYESDLAERYVRDLCREISKWNEVENPSAVETIYFGGGTPSLLDENNFDELIDAMRKNFSFQNENFNLFK